MGKASFPDEQSLDSPEFNIGGTTWYFKIFPNGFSKASAGHASLYLYAERFPSNVTAVSANGIIEVKQANLAKKLSNEDEPDREFSKNIMSWGFHNFASHSELDTLGDQDLVISAKIEITRDPLEISGYSKSL